jgi:hypothetical protein
MNSLETTSAFLPSYPTAKPELQLWGPFLEGLGPLHATNRGAAANACAQASKNLLRRRD